MLACARDTATSSWHLVTTRSYDRDLSETFAADRATRPGEPGLVAVGNELRLPDAERDPQRRGVPGRVGRADDDPVEPAMRELRAVEMQLDADEACGAERQVQRRRVRAPHE